MNRTIVLIPSYNSDRGELEKTLGSIISQTEPADICIIDDGSNDPVTFGEYPNVFIIRKDRNEGITSALIDGVNFALIKGYEFVARLDVGDFSRNNRIEAQQRTMDERPRVDILGSIASVIDDNGRHIYNFGICGSNNIKSYLWKNSVFRHSTFMIRSASIRKFGNYDPEFVLAQDYEILLRYSRLGCVECVNECLVDYIEDPNGLTVKRRKKQLRMRLKAQIKHRSLLNSSWYLGCIRTVCTAITPPRIINILKSISYR